MTVEVNFGKVIQTLIAMGITAAIVYLWNIDGRVKVLEDNADITERVATLETAMLPVLTTWKAEELLKKELEKRGLTPTPEPPVYTGNDWVNSLGGSAYADEAYNYAPLPEEAAEGEGEPKEKDDTKSGAKSGKDGDKKAPPKKKESIKEIKERLYKEADEWANEQIQQQAPKRSK